VLRVDKITHTTLNIKINCKFFLKKLLQDIAIKQLWQLFYYKKLFLGMVAILTSHIQKIYFVVTIIMK